MIRKTIAVAVRPWLWWATLRLLWRLRPEHGVIPPKEYIELRGAIYGAEFATMSTSDFLAYLRWCRRFPRSRWYHPRGVA